MIFPNLKDIQSVRIKYPQIHYEQSAENWLFVGSIDIVDNEGNYYDSYDVEIVGTLLFPRQFPKLYEHSNKFPKSADWLTFNDESCCTAVPGKEILATQNGITVLRYINEFAVPYLANQTYRKRNGNYANGEYAHNKYGEIEFFEELFFTKNLLIILRCIDLALSDKDLKNIKCVCTSDEKYKHCHRKSIKKARLLGKEYLNRIRVTCWQEFFLKNNPQNTI